MPVNTLIAILAGRGRGREGGRLRGAAKAPRAASRRSARSAAAPKPRLRRAAAPAPRPKPAPPAQVGAAAPAVAPRASGQRPHLRLAAGAPARQGGRHRSSRSSAAPARTAASSSATSRRAEAGGGASGRAGRSGAAPQPRSRRCRRACRTTQIRRSIETGSYEVVPHDDMRKIIAQRLIEVEADHPAFLPDDRLPRSTSCWQLRERDQRRRAEGRGRQARLQALGQRLRHQGAGAGAAARARRQRHLDRGRHAASHKHSDVGVAVAIPGGLITPIIRHAEQQVAVADLQRDEGPRRARAHAQAEARRNTRAASTAVSNLGMFGIKDFAAVINPPHATILAVGAGEERAVVRERQDRGRHA